MYYQNKIMYTFSSQVLQKAVLILNFSFTPSPSNSDSEVPRWFKEKEKKEYDELQRTELSKLMTSLWLESSYFNFVSLIFSNFLW